MWASHWRVPNKRSSHFVFLIFPSILILIFGREIKKLTASDQKKYFIWDSHFPMIQGVLVTIRRLFSIWNAVSSPENSKSIDYRKNNVSKKWSWNSFWKKILPVTWEPLFFLRRRVSAEMFVPHSGENTSLNRYEISYFSG